MSYPLIQNPSPFQQLAETIAGIRRMQMEREDRQRAMGLDVLRRQLMGAQIADVQSETSARDAATRSRQRQDQAIADLLRGLGSDPETDPQTAAKAARIFRALPVPGITDTPQQEPKRPTKPGAAPRPAGATRQGGLGRALSAALALDDRVPANVSEFIFNHLATNGAPPGVDPETMRLLFSGARAGAGVLSFEQVGRLVGVTAEQLRAAGINPSTKLPRNPPFSLTVGGQQDREQRQLGVALNQLQSRVDRAEALRATLLAEERVKLLSPGQRAVTGNRGREALADPILEARASAEALRRLLVRVPEYQTWVRQLREGTRQLVSQTVGGVTITGTGLHPDEEDPLDAAISDVVRNRP